MKIKQLLILFIVLYYVPIHAQFSGDFAPSNWTFSSTTTGGDGSINTSGAPASVVLSGSDNDNGACCSLYENWAITIPQTGTISFSYSMVQPDIDNSYYVINGTTYSIATSTGSGTKSAIAVTAGQTFAFRIINDDNCCGRGVLTISSFVFTPATPAITSHPSNQNLCVGNTATFTITATNATSYQWQENTGSGFNNISNGGIYSGATSTSLVLTGLTAGLSGYTYQCIATGSISPPATSNTATLTVGNPSLTAASQTNVACNGGSNGAASVNAATGGIGTYVYNWTPGNPTGDGTTSVTALTAGSWTCTVTDANSCVATRTFSITQPSALSVSSASQTNVSCNGGSNGAASVSVSGGTTSYAYNWTPGNPTGDGTAGVTGLTAGAWVCTVTDANSCVATRTFTITQPSALSVSAASQTNISCNGGSNGAASVSVSGGTTSYAYNWTPGNPTGDGTASVTGLIAGSWTCTVTDANSCVATQTFSITEPSVLSLTTSSQTNVSCYGAADGAASVNGATGGTGIVTYDWTPGTPSGDGTKTITGLTAGSWTCTATDANSCTATQTFSITQPSVLSVSAASQTNISCNGGSNGAASVSVSGGTTSYAYNWTPGNPTGDGTTSVTALTAGNWTCTVTDANSCVATRTFSITQPSALSVSSASQTNVSCNGGSNGAASVSVSGGTTSYAYNWTPGNPTGDGTASVTGLIAGSWTCTVTDAHSCVATQTISITEPLALSLSAASQTNVSCYGGSNGAASVNGATGGTGIVTYNWEPGNPTGDGTKTVTGLTAGSWTCTATDANSCTATQTFVITEPAALSVSAASQTNVSCNGGSNGAAGVSVSGGTTSYSYDWEPGNPSGEGTASVTGLTAGSWTCTVTDANACTATQTFTITEPTVFSVSAASQTNVSCYGGSNGAASVLASGGTLSYAYDWEPGNPTGDGTASVTDLTAGSWTCTLTDGNACVATQTFLITEPAALSVSAASQTNISCNGGSNGAASVSVSGGTTSYLYDWTPGNPTGDGTASVTGLIAGSWTCTVTDANSCMANQTFTITQPNAIASSQTVSICAGSTLTVGSSTYSVSGTYTDVLTAANSCDSTVTTYLTVEPAIDVTTSVNGNSITANATSASYQWIDCNGNVPISGEMNQTFTATTNGSYAVIVTVGSCSDTSDCSSIIITGINGNLNINNTIIYPNPVMNGLFTINLKSASQIIIMDAVGKVIRNERRSANQQLFNIQDEPAGIYFIKIISSEQEQVLKLIKD